MPRKNNRQKPTSHEPYKPGGGCQGKRRYPTQRDARAVIDDQKSLHPDLQLRAYQCLQCGNWHLTRKIR